MLNKHAVPDFPTAKQNVSNLSRSKYNQEIYHQIRNMHNQQNGNENAFVEELQPFHALGRVLQEKGTFFCFNQP